MKLTKIASAATSDPTGGTSCGNGPCASIYLDEKGDIIVQGWEIAPDERSQILLDTGEQAVRIPRRLAERALGELLLGRPK